MELVITAYLAIGYSICIVRIREVPDSELTAMVRSGGRRNLALAAIISMLVYVTAWPARQFWERH